jgi:hypothetical protein
MPNRMSAAKAWAIVYDDKPIYETVRRTRRECISAFMQDRDAAAVKWSERYSDRHRWKAQQILHTHIRTPTFPTVRSPFAATSCNAINNRLAV